MINSTFLNFPNRIIRADIFDLNMDPKMNVSVTIKVTDPVGKKSNKLEVCRLM